MLYDTKDGIIETALKVSSTIIPEVVQGKEFWLLMGFNIFVTTLRKLGVFEPEDYNLHLPFSLTGVTGGLMTFFVCFYNGHVFARYNKLYSLTKRMQESCLELISMLKIQVHHKDLQRKVGKLVMSSCLMFFYERTLDSSSNNSTLVSRKEYQQLIALGLLTPAECNHLERSSVALGPSAIPSFLCLQYAMETLQHQIPNAEQHTEMLFEFHSRVYSVRAGQAEVAEIMELPMPFQYFHIMNLMLFLNLFLWGYALGCEDSLFAPLIFMFVQVMFQGIRELSTALSDPFGTDEVDFPVNDWMKQLYARMYSVLEDDWDVMDKRKTGTLSEQKPLKTCDAMKQIIDVDVDNEDEGKGSPKRRPSLRKTGSEESVEKSELQSPEDFASHSDRGGSKAEVSEDLRPSWHQYAPSAVTSSQHQYMPVSTNADQRVQPLMQPPTLDLAGLIGGSQTRQFFGPLPRIGIPDARSPSPSTNKNSKGKK